MYCCGTKDPVLHKAGVLLSEQADGAGPVKGTDQAAALLEYSAKFWNPIRRVDVERLIKMQAELQSWFPRFARRGIR